MKNFISQLIPQAGIGIEFCSGDLHAFYCKRSWRGFQQTDELEIPDYQKVGPAECGRLYREFLRRNGLKAPWTVVALPRGSVLMRTLRFPKAMEHDLAHAIEYQLDSLHPFGEGSVVWDQAVWKANEATRPQPAGENGSEAEARDIQVLVAIAQRHYIEGLADWFREARIPVSQFSVTTSLLLEFASREIPADTNDGDTQFLVYASEESFEVIGSAPGKGIVSRDIPVPAGQRANQDPGSDQEEIFELLGRELERARAELRLDPAKRLSVKYCGKGILPEAAWHSSGLPFQAIPVTETASWRENIAAIAAAFAAVHRDDSPTLNLLPQERRSFESPMATMPTYALASLVVLLAIALGLRGSVQDWMYSRYLERERQALLPRIQEVERLQESNQRTMAHLAALTGFRRSGALLLDLLDELTRTLPEDAWLQQFQYEGSAVTISGTATSATAVLQAISSSSYLEAAQFSSALNRTADGKENFRIGARLRIQNP